MSAPATAPSSAPATAPVRDADVRARLGRARTTGRTRSAVVSLVLVVACVVVLAVTLLVGDVPLTAGEVVAALLGRGDPGTDLVVLTLRLPRALAAVGVGAAFGLSGAVFQSLARNPLASPDIIGVTAGAGTAAVLVIVTGTGAAGGTLVPVPVAAGLGALLTTVAIYLLAYRDGLSAYRLVLVGIAVAAALTAVTSFLLTRAEVYDVQRATVWLTGSLNGRTWAQLVPLVVALLVLVPALRLLAGPLGVLQLGDDTARGVGLAVDRSRALLVLVAVGLAAVATATAGPVAFVAFVAAPLARRLVRAPLTLAPAALVGALLVLASDLVARTAFGTVELPVGIVTGLVGAPYLLWLLARANRVGRTG